MLSVCHELHEDGQGHHHPFVPIREIRGRSPPKRFPKRRLKRLKKRARNGQWLEWGQTEGKDPPAMFASASFLISQVYNQSKASRALQ